MQPQDLGNFEQHLEIRLNTSIMGAVTDGATVRSGATLTIRGSAAGHFVIENDAILMVQGTLNGTFENHGSVIIAGVLASNLPSTGMIGAASGTIFTAKGSAVLRPDGSFDEIAGTVRNLNITVDGSVTGFLVYDRGSDVFLPMTE